MNKKHKGFPMMMTYEVRALEKLLLKQESVFFVEWGSGKSTLYFSNFLEKNQIPYTWVSVEHNKQWFNFIQSETVNKQHIHTVYKEKEDVAGYVCAPRKLMNKLGIKKFTVALVDGIHRNECLKEAQKISGTVLLHDAQRKSYKKVGFYIAGRLFKIDKKDSLISRTHILFYKLHEKMWKLKEFFLYKIKSK